MNSEIEIDVRQGVTEFDIAPIASYCTPVPFRVEQLHVPYRDASYVNI